MLITPAIASEPYCEEAPSRSTSMRLIARPGIRLRSTAALPRPTVPLILSSDETCRLLPLTSTKVWSGLRPRKVAGRSASVPSAIEGCGKLNDGTRTLRIRLVSVCPDVAIASAPNTSTGTGLSATVRSVRRVPVTMTVLSVAAASAGAAGGLAGGVACAKAGEGRRASGASVDSSTIRVGRDICFPPEKRQPSRILKSTAYSVLSSGIASSCRGLSIHSPATRPGPQFPCVARHHFRDFYRHARSRSAEGQNEEGGSRIKSGMTRKG